MIEFDWPVFYESFPSLLSALKVTLGLLVSSSTVGIVLSVLLAISARSKNKILSSLAKLHIFYYRGTPLLVQIFLIYYGSGQFQVYFENFGVWFLFKEPWFCAFLAFTLNTSAYLAEIIKGAIENLPYGEIEAAQSFGMNATQRYRRIILPRVFREIIPFWSNEVILMLKSTSLASTITLLDVMGMARKIATDKFTPIEAFSSAAIVYLAITGTLILGFKFFERKYSLNNKA